MKKIEVNVFPDLQLLKKRAYNKWRRKKRSARLGKMVEMLVKAKKGPYA